MWWNVLLYSSCVFSVTHTLGSHLFSSNPWVVRLNISAGLPGFFLRNTHFFVNKKWLPDKYAYRWLCFPIKGMGLENHHRSSTSNACGSYLVFETCLLSQYKSQRNLHVQFQHSGSTWVLVWVSQKQNLRWGLLQERFIEEVFSGEISKGGEVMTAKGKKPRVSAQVKFQPQSEPVGALQDKYCCRGHSTLRHGELEFLTPGPVNSELQNAPEECKLPSTFCSWTVWPKNAQRPKGSSLKKVDSLSS